MIYIPIRYISDVNTLRTTRYQGLNITKRVQIIDIEKICFKYVT